MQLKTPTNYKCLRPSQP